MPHQVELPHRFTQALDHARLDDLMARPGLSADEHFTVILAVLAALPLDAADLDREIHTLLSDGCSSDLAEDVLVQLAAHLGFPRARAALTSMARVRKDLRGYDETTEHGNPMLDPEERYKRGIEDYARLNPKALSIIQGAFGEVAGEMIDLTFRAFGDVYASSRQSLIIRQLATISALAVLGSAAPQLRFYIGAAPHVGVTPDQVVEAIAWVQFLAGMPAAYNALVGA